MAPQSSTIVPLPVGVLLSVVHEHRAITITKIIRIPLTVTPLPCERNCRILRQEDSMPTDTDKEDTHGAGPDQSGASQVRSNTAKVAGAESGTRSVTDKLKAQGDAMAKKHGG